MFNKKILAATIAAAVSLNANAVIDLTKTGDAVKYASETVSNSTIINAGAVLNFTTPIGLNLPIIAGGSPFYVRIELSNAEFATNAVIDATLVASAGTPTETLINGGTVGTKYAVYSYSNTAATVAADTFAFGFDTTSDTDLEVLDATKPIGITYKLYQNSDSLAALNGGAGEVATRSLDVASFVTGKDVAKTFAGIANTALVAKTFKEFKASASVGAGKKASLGVIDMTVKAGVLAADDSSAVLEGDVFTVSSTNALTGDFSYGKTWWISAAVDCTTTAATANKLVISGSTATVPALDYTGDYALCVEVTGSEVIPRVSTAYTSTLTGAKNGGVAGNLGTIKYDTTAIVVPYLTTYSGYNQRIYIQNNSGNAAPFTTTFTTETGTTYTAGSAAIGSVDSKGLIAIKATDLVSFGGMTTRGSAVIEIEAPSDQIQATTQTINSTDKSTDTVQLTVKGS